MFFIIYRRQSTKQFSNSERREFRTQFKVFITVSLILFLCFLTYGIPTILSLIGLVHDLGDTIRAYSTLYTGFGTLINAALNVFLYLFKHNEIRKYFMLYLSEKFPSMKKRAKAMGIFTVTVRSHSKTSKH